MAYTYTQKLSEAYMDELPEYAAEPLLKGINSITNTNDSKFRLSRIYGVVYSKREFSSFFNPTVKPEEEVWGTYYLKEKPINPVWFIGDVMSREYLEEQFKTNKDFDKLKYFAERIYGKNYRPWTDSNKNYKDFFKIYTKEEYLNRINDGFYFDYDSISLVVDTSPGLREQIDMKLVPFLFYQEADVTNPDDVKYQYRLLNIIGLLTMLDNYSGIPWPEYEVFDINFTNGGFFAEDTISPAIPLSSYTEEDTCYTIIENPKNNINYYLKGYLFFTQIALTKLSNFFRCPIVHKVVDIDYKPTLEEYNPNYNGGDDEGSSGVLPSEPGGGDGTFDNTSDNIDRPSLPTLGATYGGLYNIYNPKTSELKDFAKFCWSPNFLEQIGRWFSDPADAVISLGIIPISLPEYAKQDVSIGFLPSGVTMGLVTNQFVELNCGTLKIDKYYGSYLDYSPHTNIDLYLPFVGYTSLSPDEVMGKSITVNYKVDISTGSFLVDVSVINGEHTYIINSYSGNCMTQIPLSSRSFDNRIAGMFNTIANAYTSGGSQSLQDAGNTLMTTGNPYAAAAVGGAGLISEAKGYMVDTVFNAVRKPSVKTGALSPNTSLFVYKKPYIIINRPYANLPENYQSYNGFASNMTSQLSNLTGFTKVIYCKLEGFSRATGVEKEKISSLLQGGVIL